MRSLSKSYLIALFVVLLALLPIAVLLNIAIDANQLFYTGHFTIFLNTVAVAFATAGIAVLLGVPIALATTYLSFPFRRVWLVVLLVPLAIPSYVGAFALYAAFGTGGELDILLPITPPAISGLTGAVLVMALYTYPFVVLTTRASLSKIDPSQLYAARTLGLGLPASLWRVIIPRILNGIAGGALLAGLYAISDFGTPAIMGVNTYTRAIYVEYNALGLGQAAGLSLQLILIVSLLLALESQAKIVRSAPGRLIKIKPTGTQKFFLFLFISPIILLSILLPIFIFTLWLAREGFSTFDFSIVFNSIFVSVIAAIFAILLALPIAIAALEGKIGKFMERITYIGFGIPGIVMGTALVYVGLQLPLVYQTFVLLIFAYVLRFLPLGVSSVRNSLEGFDDSLTNAARSLGANSSEAFKRITLPLLFKSIIAGAALVFLETMRELPATLLLGPTGFETLATYLWRVYEAGYFGRAAIPGLLIILASVITLLVMMSAEGLSEDSD